MDARDDRCPRRQGGLKRRDASDPNSFKVRRGKVGGYRDYFPDEQVAELEALMAEKLSPSLGYQPGEQAPDGVRDTGS